MTAKYQILLMIHGEFQWNTGNKYKKHNITRTSIKVWISRKFLPLNQQFVLVNVYPDGSVSICHREVEIGQGFFTNGCSNCRIYFEMPISCINIHHAVGNSFPISSIYSGEIECTTKFNACEQIRRFLKREKSWIETIEDF
jgi:xanthine dehydrogenase molybdopterin-binding subunit B